MKNSQQDRSIELFIQRIREFLPAQQIIRDLLQRYGLGTDASFYRLLPQLVVRVATTGQVQGVIRAAAEFQVPLTFRAAGTSLSGQAITDQVLVILSHDWQQIEILEQGQSVRLQPGVIGAAANQALASYGRKIGPDPASINSCKIGGMAANNASGMCCGVKHNSYHTLQGISIVLADGSYLDSTDDSSRQQFSQTHQDLLSGLVELRESILSDPTLVDRIQHKYRLKNTTGYGINALLDYSDPIEILCHLMIGSEGTLGFINDITYRTVAVPAFKATGLFIFDDINVASRLVSELAGETVEAVELMDAKALLSVQDKLPDSLSLCLASPRSAGLLIEFGAENNEQFSQRQQRLQNMIDHYADYLLTAQPFSQDEDMANQLWQIRKGMFPAVGAVRATGTTVIIEDVAVPVEQLADGVARLQQLFGQFGYHEAIIFGHALAGNLHFVFTQAFDSQAEIQRYDDFMAAVTQLIAVEYQGSLKAEHGTGRNMAPFVELEWGTPLYRVMEQLKRLFDPLNIFNPGVIINADDKAHLQHLKQLPQADPIVDTCIECGFCESVCPSKNLTLTPRQRIAVWRRVQQLKGLSAPSAAEQQQCQELAQGFRYQGIDSCAATGLCAEQCPVGIDTGALIKSLRQQQHSGQKVATWTANHFSAATSIARFSLNSVDRLRHWVGENSTQKLFNGLHHLSGHRVPRWYPSWPAGAVTDLPDAGTPVTGKKVVYIPSCANRMFGSEPDAQDQRALPHVLASVLNKAGIELLIPDDLSQLCCGMPWASKGYPTQADEKAKELYQMAWQASEFGRWPMITDASPCALRMHQQGIRELTEYLLNEVVPQLRITPVDEPMMLHITCSSTKLDKGQALRGLAELCCRDVHIPTGISCCGFAGDKGFTLPELNASALHSLARQVPKECVAGISNSRSCEIGLSHHAGVPYQSVLYLLDQVSEAGDRSQGNSGM